MSRCEDCVNWKPRLRIVAIRDEEGVFVVRQPIGNGWSIEVDGKVIFSND